jgi:hypothetical protein
MPRHRIDFPHALGRAEAAGRLRATLDRARSFSDLQGDWSDDRLTFSVSIQGVRIQGTVEAGDQSITLDCRLPLVAMPFRGWIPRMLAYALAEPAGGTDDPTAIVEAPPGGSSRPAHAILFLHIPKAGGTTLGDFIYNHCHEERLGSDGSLDAGVLFLSYGFLKEPGLRVPDFVRPALARPDLLAVVGHFWFGLHEHVARPSTYVTVLRDPVERTLSLYHYLQLGGQMSIEEFVRSPPVREVDNDQTRRIAGVDPEVGGCTAATLRIARENLERHFSVVGVTERLAETMALLEHAFGWTREIGSFPRNVNASRPETPSLPPASLALIRSRNELDIELHHFANELLDRALARAGPALRGALERLGGAGQ